MRSLFAACLALLALGCAEPDPARDAGTDAGAEDAAVAAEDAGGGDEPRPPAPPAAPAAGPSPPAPPAPPAADDCGPWDRVTDREASACAPWNGAAEPPTCPAGEAAFGDGCRAPGAACPPGSAAWRADLPASGVRYVERGATSGDGSRTAPFGSIAEAAAGAVAGDVIALAAGRFEAAVTLPGGVELWGRCPAQTVLAPAGATALSLEGDATVRDLTIESDRDVAQVDAGTLAVRGVWVARVGQIAFDVRGDGRIELRDSVVDGPPPATGGSTLRAAEDGTLDLEAVVVRAPGGVGIRALERARLELRDAALLTTGGLTEWIGLELGSTQPARVRRLVTAGGLRVGASAALDGDQLATVQPDGAAWVRAGARLDVRGLHSAGRGLLADGGDITVTDLIATADPLAGNLNALDDGSLRIERGLVHAWGAGVSASHGGALTLLDVAIVRGPLVDGTGALDLFSDASARLERVRITGTAIPRTRVGLSMDEATVTGSDLEVIGGDGLQGLNVGESSLTLARVRLLGVGPYGVIARRGTTAVIDDLDVDDLQALDATSGPLSAERIAALMVLEGADVTLTRARVTDSAGLAFSVAGEGSRLALVDARIERTRGREDLGGDRGYALIVSDRAAAEVSRVAVTEPRAAAFRALSGASLTLSDATIDDVRPDDTGAGGRALEVTSGARAIVDRVSVRRAGDVALLIAGTLAEATLRDVRVRESVGADDGTLGHGLTVAGSARVTLERAELDGARELGLSAFDPFTRITASDVRITATRPRSDGVGGIGVGVYDEADVSLERFAITDAGLCGLQLARAGATDLSRGLVARNPVGANLQVEGYDLDRLRDRVRYVDNGVAFDGELLPIPGAVTPLDD